MWFLDFPCLSLQTLPFLFNSLIICQFSLIFLCVYLIYLCNPLSFGCIAPPLPLLPPSCPSSLSVFNFLCLCVHVSVLLWLNVSVYVALWCGRRMVTVFTKRSLLTFSVSRIPFREDPPPDIIPPPWAGRSVAPHWEREREKKSFSAAESQMKLLARKRISAFPQMSNYSVEFHENWQFLWWE